VPAHGAASDRESRRYGSSRAAPRLLEGLVGRFVLQKARLTMIQLRTALFTISASLLAAHHASANCIDQFTAKQQIDALASLVTAAPYFDPAAGNDLQTAATPFLDGWEMPFSGGGSFWLDGCNVDTDGLVANAHGFRIGGLVIGLIQSKYENMDGPLSALSWPVTDEMETPSGDGRVSYFEGQFTDGTPDGAIYWSPASGALSMHGIIFQQFQEYRETKSTLGYPTSDERACTAFGCPSGGRENAMQHGFMEYSPTTNTAWGVLNDITSGTLHLSVSNSALPHQTGQLAQLHITGSGFTPNAQVKLFFNTVNARTPLTTVTANAAGNLPMTGANLSSTDGLGVGGTEIIGTVEASGGGQDLLAGVQMQ
jgi:hypothetical protein